MALATPSTETTYRRVFVPLDGTPFSEAALRPAAEIASRAGAALHVATALPQGASKAVMTEPIPVDEAEPIRRSADLDRYLEEVEERLREEWSCAVSSRLVSNGAPAAALVRHVEELGADLVVAATHSKSLAVRAFVGSAAVDLVRGSPCPVLLVPADDPEPDPLRTPLQGSVDVVVAAVDPVGDPDDVALSHALLWARLWDARLHLVHATLDRPLPAVDMEGAGVSAAAGVPVHGREDEEIAERLERIARGLRERGIDARSETLHGPRASDAVVEFVERIGADLVVAGRHDRSVVERIWMGSESDRLARRLRSAGLLICPLAG